MLRKTSLLLLGIVTPLAAMACGGWTPERFLDDGGKKILFAPEFYFELEMKQLASHYPTPFKKVTVDKATADSADYQDALKTGRAKSTGPDDTKPYPKEFELYDKGATAYHDGKLDEARAAWKAVLALPAEERHYRSTWAAYMLGRMNIERPFKESGDDAEAKPSDEPSAEKPKTANDKARDEETVGYFRQVRELAKNGFADSLGLAASSLGWEAFVELNRHSLDKAAELYLQQLSAGYLNAVNSLNAVAGQLHDDTATDNATLRRLKTASILCFAMDDMRQDQVVQSNVAPLLQWLSAVEKAPVEKVEEAERLAWVAYSLGQFDAARRWLKRADPEMALALWLKAKLDFRDGHIEEATAAMSKAIQKIPSSETLETRYPNEWEVMPSEVAAGDLGLLQLARSEFDAAFHAFLKGGHWQDAAFVAERIFSVSELRRLVDKEFPAKPEDETPEANQRERGWWYPDRRIDMRWLLARRLTRQGQFPEARPYFLLKYRETLDRYASALKRAENKKAKPEDRAKALLEAALIARYNGMELLGTEVEPDAAVWGGAFSESDVYGSRVKGEYKKSSADPATAEAKKVVLPASEAERKRLAQNKVEPEKRYHYRYTAASYAWRAAKLLPDNSELTADVLNTAGSWLKNQDSDAADPFMQAIERRCQKTEIGKAVLKKHWFVDMGGPWSSSDAFSQQ